jgi:hypothetical protein
LETTPVAQKQWEFSIFEALDSLGSTKVQVFLEFSNLFKLSGERGDSGQEHWDSRAAGPCRCIWCPLVTGKKKLVTCVFGGF